METKRKFIRSKSNLNHFFLIAQATFNKFITDRCSTKAAALTYYSLLAVVPLLATLFGVSKGFGLDQVLEDILQKRFAEHREFLDQIITFSIQTLENTKGSWIAGIGALILFWTLIKVFSHLERIVNQIWQVHKLRPLIKRYSDYLSLVLLCPFLLIATSSFNIFLAKSQTLANLYILPLVPYFIISILFVLLFIFLPNCKVHFKPALIAGSLTGFFFQALQKTFLFSQIYVTNLGPIYGSFAALPLFIVWLNISWIIFLFGSQLSFILQNFESYIFWAKAPKFNNQSIKKLCVQITTLLARDLIEGNTTSITHIFEETQAPLELIKECLSLLEQAKIIHQAHDDKSATYSTYALSHSPNKLKLYDILNALDNIGANLKTGINPFFDKTNLSFNQMIQDMKDSQNNLEISKL